MLAGLLVTYHAGEKQPATEELCGRRLVISRRDDKQSIRQYSSARMEAAAERALRTGACRYQSVKSMLKNSLDAVRTAEPPPSPRHDNIRGAEYFD
jgi:hypothetical protein